VSRSTPRPPDLLSAPRLSTKNLRPSGVTEYINGRLQGSNDLGQLGPQGSDRCSTSDP
jgi:hypothetical protein